MLGEVPSNAVSSTMSFCYFFVEALTLSSHQLPQYSGPNLDAQSTGSGDAGRFCELVN